MHIVNSNTPEIRLIIDTSFTYNFACISLQNRSSVTFPYWPILIVWRPFFQSSSSFWIGISLMIELIKARPLEGVRLWQISAILMMNQTTDSSIGSSGIHDQDNDEYQIAFYNLSDILSSEYVYMFHFPLLFDFIDQLTRCPFLTFFPPPCFIWNHPILSGNLIFGIHHPF